MINGIIVATIFGFDNINIPNTIVIIPYTISKLLSSVLPKFLINLIIANTPIIIIDPPTRYDIATIVSSDLIVNNKPSTIKIADVI